MNKINKLKEVYAKTSKHSNYQILPSDLEQYLSTEEIEVKSRNEKLRLNYILSKIDIENKKVLDIGGNTGYFTFEFLSNGANSVDYYEGNTEHADFVKIASEVLHREDQIKVHSEYYDFNKSDRYDIVLLLNVLHHIGDDFGDEKLSKKKALEAMLKHLNNLLQYTDILVFQLGFNWKGDINLPLFKNGTKKELVDFVKNNLASRYEIVNIGVAENIENEIVFKELNEKNILRDDSLGEFLNRPIFIIKSKNQV